MELIYCIGIFILPLLGLLFLFMILFVGLADLFTMLNVSISRRVGQVLLYMIVVDDFTGIAGCLLRLLVAVSFCVVLCVLYVFISAMVEIAFVVSPYRVYNIFGFCMVVVKRKS